LAVSVVFCDDEATLKIAGEPSSSPEMLETQLQELVDQKPMRVMLDLFDLELLSSIGLGLILSLRRAVIGYGGEVRIAKANPAVLDVLRRTSVDVLFDPNLPRASSNKTD
jgi:anti-anti-sigma factor